MFNSKAAWLGRKRVLSSLVKCEISYRKQTPFRREVIEHKTKKASESTLCEVLSLLTHSSLPSAKNGCCYWKCCFV